MTTLAESPVNYLNVRHTVASWLLTKDHKRIGLMYLVVVTFAFFLGGIFASGIRLELATPAGDFVSADTYNKLFTMHGVAMVFFVLIPAVPTTKTYQLRRLIFGNATSLAPSISGRTKLPRIAGTAGIRTKKTIMIPCIVNSRL